MTNLIVPMAGKFSRYGGLRPKWMLTHPKNNRFMVTEAISGLNLDLFDKIFLFAYNLTKINTPLKRVFLRI